MTTYRFRLDLDSAEICALESATNFFKLREVKDFISKNPQLISEHELRSILNFIESNKLNECGELNSTSSFLAKN